MTPEEYAKRHKDAFRIAFNYLNQHFPPQEDPAWWVKAADDMSLAYEDSDKNPLIVKLLNAVYDYIGVDMNERREHDNAINH